MYNRSDRYLHSIIFGPSHVLNQKESISVLCRLVMFTNPLSERSKLRLKTELDSKARSFIEKMEQFALLQNHDKELVNNIFT